MIRVLTKRELAKIGSLTAVALAATAAGCTQTQLSDIEKQFADVINQIQAGVKNACAASGTFVPTANTVLEVLVAIMGSSSVAGVTAAVISQAVKDIVGAACPTTPAAGRPAAAARPVTINGKPVNVVFY